MDHDIASFVIFNDIFYGGSNTSGKVLRLDYGTNDDGSAIAATYETPDILFGSPYLQKTFHEIWLDVQKESNSTLSLGISVNGGAYANSSISLSGSGLLFSTIRNVTPKGNMMRLRFYNNDLDKDMEVHSASILYQPTMIRQ